MDAEPPGLAVAALVGLIVGPILALELATFAGVRVGSPGILRVVFAGWVLLPYAALALVRGVSRRWSEPARTALQAMTLAAAAASTFAYAYTALGAARPATAVFVLVPPVSGVLTLVVVGAAALVDRKF